LRENTARTINLAQLTAAETTVTVITDDSQHWNGPPTAAQG
jgi:hypothetical protein